MCPLKAIRFVLDHILMFLSSSHFRAGRFGIQAYILRSVPYKSRIYEEENKESNVRERTVHSLHAFNDFLLRTNVKVVMARSV